MFHRIAAIFIGVEVRQAWVFGVISLTMGNIRLPLGYGLEAHAQVGGGLLLGDALLRPQRLDGLSDLHSVPSFRMLPVALSETNIAQRTGKGNRGGFEPILRPVESGAHTSLTL